MEETQDVANLLRQLDSPDIPYVEFDSEQRAAESRWPLLRELAALPVHEARVVSFPPLPHSPPTPARSPPPTVPVPASLSLGELFRRYGAAPAPAPQATTSLEALFRHLAGAQCP